MDKKIAVMSFPSEGAAFEAFSKIKNTDGGGLQLKQMAIIEREKNNTSFNVKDYLDFDEGNQVFRDGFIGIIVGILGGPLGVLAGWIVGDLAGLSQNHFERKHNDTIFDEVSKKISPGSFGVLLYFKEENGELLDTIVKQELHGTITRFDYKQVKKEVKEASLRLK